MTGGYRRQSAGIPLAARTTQAGTSDPQPVRSTEHRHARAEEVKAVS
jgi:hypothetical protein